jgi:hypothetical protein
MHRDETIITDLCLTIKADTLTRIIHISNSIFYVSTFSYTKIKQEADFDNPRVLLSPVVSIAYTHCDPLLKHCLVRRCKWVLVTQFLTCFC